MEERGQVSRRQVLARGGIIAIAVGMTGVSVRAAGAKPGTGHWEAQPCLGEPGYAERVSKLFRLGRGQEGG